jgi:hypothetical protein
MSKANSHFGKLTAISNNWSKSTAVAFVFQKQEIFFQSAAIPQVTVTFCPRSDFFETFVP